jgi:hypothetical protein
VEGEIEWAGERKMASGPKARKGGEKRNFSFSNLIFPNSISKGF